MKVNFDLENSFDNNTDRIKWSLLKPGNKVVCLHYKKTFTIKSIGKCGKCYHLPKCPGPLCFYERPGENRCGGSAYFYCYLPISDEKFEKHKERLLCSA